MTQELSCGPLTLVFFCHSPPLSFISPPPTFFLLLHPISTFSLLAFLSYWTFLIIWGLGGCISYSVSFLLPSLSTFIYIFFSPPPMLLILGEWSKQHRSFCSKRVGWKLLVSGSKRYRKCDALALRWLLLHSTCWPAFPGQTIVRSGWKYNTFIFFCM
jgi:hypothetical protein